MQAIIYWVPMIGLAVTNILLMRLVNLSVHVGHSLIESVPIQQTGRNDNETPMYSLCNDWFDYGFFDKCMGRRRRARGRYDVSRGWAFFA